MDRETVFEIDQLSFKMLKDLVQKIGDRVDFIIIGAATRVLPDISHQKHEYLLCAARKATRPAIEILKNARQKWELNK